MNKQALTFLSLFSLILMLSIYYILLPPIDVVLPVDGQIEQNGVEVIDFQVLRENLASLRDEEVASYNEIISSSTSSLDQISDALNKISTVNTRVDIEKKLTESIKQLGYDDVFIEISDQIARISIQNKKGTTDEVTVIINTAYNQLDSKYLIEVKFVG